MTGRRQREFAALPPGIVRVRLEGESAAGLAALLPTLPGVAIVTGPDIYDGNRIYLTVAVLSPEGRAEAAIPLPNPDVR